MKKMIMVLAVLAAMLLHSDPAQAQNFIDEDNALFWERYQVEESTSYLIPDTTQMDELTEWDWVEMEPRKDRRHHQSQMDGYLTRSERIDVLEQVPLEDWERKIGYLLIDGEAVTTYDELGALISHLPHSEYYLALEDTLTQAIAADGLQPMLPFPVYEDLPFDDLQDQGFFTEPTENGYRIWNDLLSITIDPVNHIRTTKIEDAEFDQPFYALEAYSLSEQGYLMPAFQEIQTKTLSRKGQCLVKVETEVYQDYQMYYDPAILFYEESSGPEENFTIFPNPTSGEFEIEYTGSQQVETPYELSITNQMGTEVQQESGLNTGDLELIDISALPDGFYVLHFYLDNQQFSKTLFKN